MDQSRNYATLRLIVRHGAAAAAVLGIIVAAAFLAIFAAYGLPAWTLPAGLGGAAVLYGLLRSYVEIVQLIAETLLPR